MSTNVKKILLITTAAPPAPFLLHLPAGAQTALLQTILLKNLPPLLRRKILVLSGIRRSTEWSAGLNRFRTSGKTTALVEIWSMVYAIRPCCRRPLYPAADQRRYRILSDVADHRKSRETLVSRLVLSPEAVPQLDCSEIASRVAGHGRFSDIIVPAVKKVVLKLDEIPRVHPHELGEQKLNL